MHAFGPSGLLANTEDIDGGGEVAIGALLAGVGACSPQASLAWVDLRGCAGARIGMLTVEASGLDDARSPTRVLLDPWLEAELSWPIGAGVRLRAQATGHVPLIRDTIQVLDENRHPRRAYRVSALSLGVGLGLVVAIGE